MRKLGLVLAGILLLPSAAFAQSSIAGIVKDTSGAVLFFTFPESAADPAALRDISSRRTFVSM